MPFLQTSQPIVKTTPIPSQVIIGKLPPKGSIGKDTPTFTTQPTPTQSSPSQFVPSPGGTYFPPGHPDQPQSYPPGKAPPGYVYVPPTSGGGGGGGGTTPTTPPSSEVPTVKVTPVPRTYVDIGAIARARGTEVARSGEVITSGGVPGMQDREKEFQKEVTKRFFEATKRGGLKPGEAGIITKQVGGEMFGTSGEKIVYDAAGKPVAVESTYLGKTLPYDKYQSEVQRIQANLPQEQYFNPKTGKISATSGILFEKGDIKLTTTPVKVYTDPNTRMIIENLSSYLKEKNIPAAPPSGMSFEEFKQSLKVEPKYDLQGLVNYGRGVGTLKPTEIYGSTMGGGKLETGQTEQLLTPAEIVNIYTLGRAGAAIGTAKFLSGAATTGIAFGLNAQKLDKVLQIPATIENAKEQALSLGELGIIVGIAGLSSAVVGAGLKVAGKVAQTSEALIIGRLATEGERFLPVATALGLKGTSFAIEKGTDIYFKTLFVGEGLEAIRAFKEGRIVTGETKVAELLGGLGGFIGGTYLGDKAVTSALKYSGKYIEGTIEKPTIKREPPNIQIEKLTEPNSEIYLQRLGYIKPGAEYIPPPNPTFKSDVGTKQIFFRTSEVKGVEGNVIQPALTIPTFTAEKSYFDLFREVYATYPDLSLGQRFYKTILTTPVSKVSSISIISTKPIINRAGVIEESATRFLSKKTQTELLKQDTLISEKVIKISNSEEEAVLRKPYKLKSPIEVYVTTDAKGKVIPVLVEKQVGINQEMQAYEHKKIILEQNAKYIERNLGQQMKFKEDALFPFEHTIYGHGARVVRNIFSIVDISPDIQYKLIKKFGNLEKAKDVLRQFVIHDIGKTSASSREFGTPHGKKLANVAKAGLLKYRGKTINLNPSIVEAIRVHEILDPRTIRYKIKDLFGKIDIVSKLGATGDRLDITREGRYKKAIDPFQLPLKEEAIKAGLVKPGTPGVIRSLKYSKMLSPSENILIDYISTGIKNVAKYPTTIITTANISREYISPSKYQTYANYPTQGYVLPYYSTSYYSLKPPFYTPYKEPTIPYPSYKESYTPYVPYIPSRTISNISYTPYETKFPNIFLLEKKEKNEGKRNKARIAQAKAYALLIRRRGKFIPRATGLTKAQAYFQLQNILLRNIARTGKVVPTGKTIEVFGNEEEARLNREIFREYKIRGGKQIATPMQFTQRTRYNIQSPEEKEYLRQARIMKQAGAAL